MPWETIENAKPKYYKPPVAAKGIRVATRAVLHGKRYIAITIGAELARAVRITQEKQQVRLMFGTGSDAGRVGCAVDVGGGLRRPEAEVRQLPALTESRCCRGLVRARFRALQRRLDRGDPTGKRPAANVRLHGFGRDARG